MRSLPASGGSKKASSFMALFFDSADPDQHDNGTHIKCGGCKTRYKPSVLTQQAAV